MDWNLLLSEKRERLSDRKRDIRNEFESDLGRVIFSPAVRRMHDKTQVFPLNTDDNIHTRLTHSMEVYSVAYSLGLRLCDSNKIVSKFSSFDRETILRSIPIILATSGLVHDIGNPPFGHFGERAVAEYFSKFFKENNGLGLSECEKKDFLEFDGNAQGLRVLSKAQVLQDTFGLNLTYGVLSILLKYPFTSDSVSSLAQKDGYFKKFGVFQSEKSLLENIQKEMKLINFRNPLTFLLEAADDICYRVMDIEDGFNKKYYKFEELYKYIKSHGNVEVQSFLKAFEKTKRGINRKKVNKYSALMSRFRTAIIQNLVDCTMENFMSNLDEIERGTYSGELIYCKASNLANLLKDFEEEYIFPKREIHKMELTGRSVIQGLLKHFTIPLLCYSDNKQVAKRLETLISSSFKTIIMLETGKEKVSDFDTYWKLRLIVDYISGMTDKFALKLFQDLEGISVV